MHGEFPLPDRGEDWLGWGTAVASEVNTMLRVAAALLGIVIGSFSACWLWIGGWKLYWRIVDPTHDIGFDIGAGIIAVYFAIAGGIIGAIIGIWIAKRK